MAFQPILSIHTWVSLPNDVRDRIRTIFSISRSSHVQVNDGKIETDGTTPQDFQSLTVDKMQTYLNTKDDDFLKLFDMVVAKVKAELNPSVTITASTIEVMPDLRPDIGYAPTALAVPKKKKVIKKKK